MKWTPGFVRGDVCLIRNVEGVQKPLRGRECTILTPLRNIRGLMRYEIDVDGLPLPEGWVAVAIPEHLEKLPPPWLASTWEQCAWRPSVLVDREKRSERLVRA